MQKHLRSTTASPWSGWTRRLKRFSGRAALGSSLFLSSWLFAGNAEAQSVSNYYDFSASTGTYTPLGASANNVSNLVADDAVSAALPLGFTFNFGGTDYTQVYANSNGWLSFGTGAGTISAATSRDNLLASIATTNRPLIAPLWDDHEGTTASTSKASYEVTGAAGSRVFTFEWSKWEWNYSATAAGISFQVKLYEGSNRIEYIYQQEPGALASASASIGLAGAGTGPGNFISLNNATATPTASYTTETTTISTKPATGQIYAFTRANAAVDVQATALTGLPANGCFGTNQTVQVTIRNNGTAVLDFAANPVTVSAVVTGTNPTTLSTVVNTGTLAVGATQDVTVSTTYNMSTAGTYTFNASATTPADTRTANDAMITAATRTVSATAVAVPVALPQSVNFTGFTGTNLTTLFPNWREGSGVLPAGTTSTWLNKTGLGGATNVVAKINLFSNSAKEWIVGPKITPTATTALQFKAAVTTYNALTPHATGMAGTDDKVQVMVSTDCGATFNPIYTLDGNSGLTNVLTNQFVSLAAYAGQNIVVAIYATDGSVDDTPDYDFNIDDVFIGTPAAGIDLGATAFVTPAATGCYTATQSVSLTIRNFTSTPIDFSTTNATVGVRVSGATGAIVTTTLNSGILAAGATQDVVVGNINMGAAGTYNLRGFTSIAGDTDAGSDTTRASRVVTPTIALPQRVDFTGFTGSNLTTVFPNWKEAAGTFPAGTTSSWTSKADLGLTGNVSARINLFSNSKKEWIVGPKVTPTATSSLRFSAAITDAAANTADAAGMQGTDDKVQVMISSDCGTTFTPLYTFDASNTATLTNVLTDQTISLAPYAGQNVIIAFYATEGTADDTPDYDFVIDDIFIGTIPAIDLGVTAVVNPVTTACFGPAENVTVTVRNFSNLPIDFSTNNATVSVRTHGAVGNVISTTLNTGTLAPGATQNVSVGNLNMQTAGTYNFRAYTTVATDGFAGNDTARTSRVVAPTLALPQRLDFAGFTGANLTTLFPNWKEAAGAAPAGTTSAWANSSALGIPGNVTAMVNLSGASKKEWIIGPKVTPTATSSLRFNAAITDAGSGAADAAGMQGTDDKVQVMVSTDCGITFTPIFTFDASNTTTLTNILTDQVISLAPYAGQNIIIAFFATEGSVDDTPSYDFHIDDIFIGTLPAVDLGTTVFINPATTGCYSGTENVTVTIKNFATTPINFATTNATVSVRTHGGAANLVSTTLNTGTLAPGATQDVSIGNVNMIPAGTYTFRAYTTVAGDGFAGNDTARTTRTVVPAVALPQAVDFTGFTGTNLNTLFPNWNEATGAATATPTIASSNWVNSTGLGGANNTTARINLYTNNRSDWMIGPKVMPTATTSLRFRAAITAFAALTPHATGMAGTDDKVQVMVSTNCGVSYTPIYTFDASNTTTLTNVLTDQVISLAPYAGQNIIVAFYGIDGPTDNTPDYDFHIDDIFIGTVAPVDVQATTLVSPVTSSGCFGSTRDVTVTVRNFGTTPIDFATNNATVTVNVTGAATQTLTTTINSNALNNGTPLAPFGTINVVVGTLNMTTPGTYTFNASATAAGDGNTANDAMAPVNIVAAPVAAGTAAAASASVCVGNTTTLSLTGNTGGNIQWQQGTSATGPFTDIAGATTSPFATTTPINATAYFRAVLSCGTTAVNSNVVTVTVSDPQITASAGAARCGAGTVALSATPNTGATINWFASATGGAPLASGTTYSPNVTATTTFYAEATTGTTSNLGKVSTTGTDGKNTGGGLIFNATVPFTLNSVVVYSDLAAGGNLIVNLKNAAGTVIQTATVALPGVTGMTAITVPLNFNVPVGTGFTLEQGSALSLYRDFTSVPYPYTSTVATITNGTLAGYYYFFYNWSISVGCRSARTPVVATVNPVPVVALGATQNVCGATSTTLDAGNASSTFQWSLNGTAITGATSQTLVATTAGTYSVVVTNATNCTGTGSVQVTFNTNPAVPTVTAGGPTTFCAGGSVVLTGASTTTGVTYTWSLNGNVITGATAATYTANAAGNYTVTATSAAGCTATSTATAVTVNALPAVPTISGGTAICAGGSLTLTAASTTPGVTYAWFLNGTAITGATAATLNATAAGNYTVVATAPTTCSATSAATTVTIEALPAIPTITIAAGGSATICQGTSVNLTGASTSSGVTYTWSLNGTLIPNASGATFSANAAGTYTVTATSATGCTATSTGTVITVTPTPAAPVITRLNMDLTSSSATGNQWFLNGVAIPGATGATHTVTANGNYTVVVTVNGCPSAASAVVNITNTGLADDFGGMGVTVFPNPTNGKFEVKLTGYTKNATINLYNLTGQLIRSQQVKVTGNEMVTPMHIENLAAGTYLLKVTSDKGVKVERLIVE